MAGLRLSPKGSRACPKVDGGAAGSKLQILEPAALVEQNEVSAAQNAEGSAIRREADPQGLDQAEFHLKAGFIPYPDAWAGPLELGLHALKRAEGFDKIGMLDKFVFLRRDDAKVEVGGFPMGSSCIGADDDNAFDPRVIFRKIPKFCQEFFYHVCHGKPSLFRHSMPDGAIGIK